MKQKTDPGKGAPNRCYHADHPGRIAFDDTRLVTNAGLILPATLARRLGLPQLVDRRLDLGDAPLRDTLTGGWTATRHSGKIDNVLLAVGRIWSVLS